MTRKTVIFNGITARVTLEGDVEETGPYEYAARGRVRVQVRAKTMTKDRFLREFYECLSLSDGTYEEAIEEYGPLGGITDDLLPALGSPTIRIYSRTLCEWKDADFTVDHYDDVWIDAGLQSSEDSATAARMRLGSGGGELEITLDMTQLAETIAARFQAGRLLWPPTIDLRIAVFLDYQAAQGEGAFFKTLNYGLTLTPSPLPLQAIVLDAAAHRYRLIAGPVAGPVGFVPQPGAAPQLTADPVPAPAGCTSLVATWGESWQADVLAVGPAGEVALGNDARRCAASTFYWIEIKDAPAGDDPFELTHEDIATFDARAMKLLADSTFGAAPEAAITVQPAGEGDLWNAVVIGDPHDRHVVLSVDQARGARAARNGSKAALTSPDDLILRRVETVHVTLTVHALTVTRALRVAITLPRWFPLEGSDQETHLRTNYATMLQGLRDAITRYNAANEPPARFNMVARDGFDKVAAGNFLFRHNTSDAIANRYFMTQPDEVEANGELAGDWLNTLYGCPPPAARPPALTEAALLVRIIERRAAKGDRLTPGEVFGLGLEETGGDIGAALLISHNTLRSLARACGDDLRTGIRALDSSRFDKLFITIRGGYRCTDGLPGALKNEASAEANFAGDNAGPWYHFFGTAYYEAYTATPDDPTPADNRWARTANVLEQWYREYCPTSWQEPDPEKECINRWGIAAADELLTEQPWMGD